jgi:FtsZ-interacting cell division protein ZipA
MSDLQISLLVIGAVVIAGVYLFNRLQERKFRRRFGQAFDTERDDVLLKGGAGTGDRMEPQLQQEAEPSSAGPAPAPREVNETGAATAAGLSSPGPGFDAALDYVAEIEAEAPIAGAAIDELFSRVSACGKPYRAEGLNAGTGEWEDLVRGSGGRYGKVRIGLQLVNRAGPVNPAQLAMFCDAVSSCAGKVAAVATCPDMEAALKLASELDSFCAGVDIAVGINIIAPDGRRFPGARIRNLAEGAGFSLEPDGIFRFRNEHRQTLFTLDNHEPAPFLPEQIKSLSTSGITLLLDVPRVPDGLKALERMFDVGARLAQDLGGELVDDNRVALGEAAIAKIRRQLSQIYAKMEARGVGAGSVAALRLFS